MRIAMISEHASPLAALGGVDAGGQNAHVAELSTALAADGHQVRVYTRRDDQTRPTVVPFGDRVEVVHVPAGPARPVPKDDLLPHMGEFAEWMAADWRDEGKPDVAHAHFWMSGLAAITAGRACRVPVVQTYHALGGAGSTGPTRAPPTPARRAGSPTSGNSAGPSTGSSCSARTRSPNWPGWASRAAGRRWCRPG
jgi:D-inositol-3-phosphate glycosyltransferase